MIARLPAALSEVPATTTLAAASSAPAASAADPGADSGTGAAGANALPIAFGEVMAGLRSTVESGVNGLALADAPLAAPTASGLQVAMTAAETAAHALASSSNPGEAYTPADEANDSDDTPDAFGAMNEAKHAASLSLMGLLSEGPDPVAVFAPPAAVSPASSPLPVVSSVATVPSARQAAAGSADQVSSMLGMSIAAQQGARGAGATATAQAAMVAVIREAADAVPPPSPTPSALLPSHMTLLPQVAEVGSTQASETAAPLTAMLGERIQLQQQQGVQQAVVNLQPHLAGNIRIEIVHDAGALHVHLSASNDDVVRQLQAVGESLRQELSSRQFTDVSVQIVQQRSQDGQGQGQGRNAQEEAEPSPSLALGEADALYDSFSRAMRRLTTSGISST